MLVEDCGQITLSGVQRSSNYCARGESLGTRLHLQCVCVFPLVYVHANLGCYGYPMGAWPVCVHMYIGAGGVR